MIGKNEACEEKRGSHVLGMNGRCWGGLKAIISHDAINGPAGWSSAMVASLLDGMIFERSRF